MSQQAKDLDEAIRLYRAAEGTPRELAAKQYLDAVVEQLRKQKHQRGASSYEVLLAIVFLPCTLVVLLLAAGYSLGVDLDKLATARAWKRKRRELNESVLARKVWP